VLFSCQPLAAGSVAPTYATANCLTLTIVGAQKMTPLHIAASHNQLSAAKVLVEKGADVKAVCRVQVRVPAAFASPRSLPDCQTPAHELAPRSLPPI
jgi:hypothetical protein